MTQSVSWFRSKPSWTSVDPGPDDPPRDRPVPVDGAAPRRPRGWRSGRRPAAAPGRACCATAASRRRRRGAATSGRRRGRGPTSWPDAARTGSTARSESASASASKVRDRAARSSPRCAAGWSAAGSRTRRRSSPSARSSPTACRTHSMSGERSAASSAGRRNGTDGAVAAGDVGRRRVVGRHDDRGEDTAAAAPAEIVYASSGWPRSSRTFLPGIRLLPGPGGDQRDDPRRRRLIRLRVGRGGPIPSSSRERRRGLGARLPEAVAGLLEAAERHVRLTAVGGSVHDDHARLDPLDERRARGRCCGSRSRRSGRTACPLPPVERVAKSADPVQAGDRPEQLLVRDVIVGTGRSPEGSAQGSSRPP